MQTNAWIYALPVLGYFYGAVPFGFLAAKLIKGVDIRGVGSGNIGATNAARVLGFRFFPLIFLLDVSKGFLPALAAQRLVSGGACDPHLLVVGTALAAILGHVFPVYLGFKGGKAVATSTGAFLAMAPWSLLIAAGVWAVMFALWRYVSLASISAAVALPASVWLLHADPVGSGRYLTALSMLGGMFIIWLHRANIRRLLSGTEHKIGHGPPRDADNTGEPTTPET